MKKRKRAGKSGSKKGTKKSKLSERDPVPIVTYTNSDDDYGTDGNEDEHSSQQFEAESPSFVAEKAGGVESTKAGAYNASIGQPGRARVKVKLKSSISFGTHPTRSDLQGQSDTDVSNSKSATPAQDFGRETKEDSNYSDGLTSDIQTSTSGKSPRKSGSIKIISSKGTGSFSPMERRHLNYQAASQQIFGERNFIPSDNEKTVQSPVLKTYKRERRSPPRDPQHNEKEVNDALLVIKKIMKMDAAEPFNTPVDPVALGIPDYFDVIDCPMDFGTICNGIEHGHKYLTSEDVFRDVQLIWDNCLKYNNKGDYIVDLMKRVKKNFNKYWTAAGLFCDSNVGATAETPSVEDIKKPSKEKGHTKGKFTKHKKRRHGTIQHKSDCLCAVCIMKRRRKEREDHSVDGTPVEIDTNIPHDTNHEVSPIDNPESEHSSLSLSRSPDQPSPSADAGGFEQAGSGRLEKMEIQDSGVIHESSRIDLVASEMLDDSSPRSQGRINGMEFEEQMDGFQNNMQQDEATPSLEGELGDKEMELPPQVLNQIKIYEEPPPQENHSVLQICRSLFPTNGNSVWRGPHSLYHWKPPSSTKQSPIHAALATLLKQ